MDQHQDKKGWAAIVGANLRATRKSAKLKLEDLSRLSGVGLASLSHIENGNRDVKLSTLIRLADALRIAVPDFFTMGSGVQADSQPDEATDQTSIGYDLGED